MARHTLSALRGAMRISAAWRALGFSSDGRAQLPSAINCCAGWLLTVK
jgi:hypothetical protein